jgi:hypothetical protein
MKKGLEAPTCIIQLIVIIGFICTTMIAHSQSHENVSSIEIPVGGNSWLLDASAGEEINNAGFSNWKSSSTVCRTFFRTNKPGNIHVWLFIESPDTASILLVTIEKNSRQIPATTGHGNRVDAGTWMLKDTGYHFIDVRALQGTNAGYGHFTAIRVEGSPVGEASSYVKNNDDNYFYWGRRGPSVHLNYMVDSTINVSWFYNEITVPVGNDVIGSYYMANGFAEGYFGIQVNSSNERRILFSIWSPYDTDDPEAIPDSLKIKMVAKGSDVQTGEFGNEGSGGQSFLRYNWKAGTTYGFLTYAQPNSGNTTTYSSWFFDTQAGSWKFIASFTRPSTKTYLKRLHSFLENFDPETGTINRKVLFSAQYVANEKGDWREITQAIFSIDQTGRKNFRKDYYGGVNAQSFILENCGFFNKYQVPGTVFTRTTSGKTPSIQLTGLPTR